MRKPRTNILLLTTILVVVGLIGAAWLAGESDSTAFDGSDSMIVVSPTVSFTGNLAASTQTSDVPIHAEGSAPHFSALAPQQLSNDASVLVVETCDLQLMADGTGLALNSGQWTAFAAVVLRFQAIRHNYEAQIGTSKAIAPGLYRMEIPGYANAGDELRGQFSNALRTELGEATALEVMAKLGDRLERRFAGFGVSVQTLDISADPARDPSDIQMTRTMSYWNSVEGSDHLTTRQEFHFPVLEDPTGDSWSALLAKAGVMGAESGPG